MTPDPATTLAVLALATLLWVIWVGAIFVLAEALIRSFEHLDSNQNPGSGRDANDDDT